VATSRPAVTVAWILGIALVVAAPGIVPAVLTAVGWALTQPVVLGVALVVTLAWCAVHQARRVPVRVVR
jgi:hypothetical protein